MSHLLHLLHGFDRLVHQLPVVLDRSVSLFLHLKGCVLQVMMTSHSRDCCELCWQACESTVPVDRADCTSASSLPASFLYALVHLTFLGFRFILKFL